MAAEGTRIAVLGGRGMLGSDLVQTCRQQGFVPIVFDLPEFDITDAGHVRQAVSDTEIIVNCAAYTNVDGAESQAELAYKVNAEAVGRLGTVARQAGKWILHISTDFVFDGCGDKPYVETDHPNPINTYGKTKLAGEQLLARSGCEHCIARVEWTYGSAGNNFVTKLIQRAKSQDMLKVVDDQTGSPTATTQAARAICKLLRKKPEGIYHFASAGYVTRYGMAEFIFDRLSMNVNLVPCKTSDFTSPATRPLNSRFNCGKIADLLDEPIDSWKGPLELFLRQL
ncbi:MAG TPA: dTDP-4-dehydrorhamnose reductase [Phycisphaerales bacterium]|nr:dTDP-4-dehydrorhamnose reductase [Phycisphaerales bacterium]